MFLQCDIIMDKIWIVSHERFRNDDESYNVLAAFETEQEASAAMIQYGQEIEYKEYVNKCSYDTFNGDIMFRIRENDISFIITQEDILRVVPVKVSYFDFNQNKILKYVFSN